MAASARELELGEQRETWCAVERMKEEAWCRKQRGHIPRYQQEMTSDVFHMNVGEEAKEERLVFPAEKPPVRKQQRHFPKIHNKSQLNL